MRLVVTDRDPAKVAGDVVVGLFRPGGRSPRLPLGSHLSPGAPRLVARSEDALTWLETRRMAAPRALLASLGEREPAGGLGGSCGDRGPADVAVRERHDLRALGASIERACNQAGARRVTLVGAVDEAEVGLIVEGILLRAYQCNEWRDKEPTTTLRQITVCTASGDKGPLQRRLARLDTITSATNWARELGDLPSNVGTPMGIVDRVRPHAEAVGLDVRVLDMQQAQDQSLGLFCAVAQGGANPGCILELEHNAEYAKGLPTLVLIGKGITHDTGGYNIKTAPNLYALTYDKCGATAVIGAMKAIAALELPLHVIAILPLAENCIDAAAFKPGDILTAMDTSTVFVENTDAEGRLVLADALCWADHYEPDAVIDLATLTRASASAMGEPYASMFTNSDELREILRGAGELTDDLVWPMPIHEQHARELNHFKADVRNMGGGTGGASTAAAFLRYFVDFPWAHVDLAGKAAWEFPRDYLGEGATGFGCRLLVEAAQRFANAHDGGARLAKARERAERAARRKRKKER